MKDLPFSFYEFLAILMPGFIFTMTCYTALGSPWNGLDLEMTINSLYIICSSYIIGQVLSQLSLLIIEKPTKTLLGEPALVVLGKHSTCKPLELIFSTYYQQIPQSDVAHYLELIKTKNEKEIASKTAHTIFSKARQNTEVFEKLNGWTRLIGFSRNLTLTLIVLSILFFLTWYYSSKENFNYISYFFLFIAIIMFFRYLRFLRVFNTELIQWYNLTNSSLL